MPYTKALSRTLLFMLVATLFVSLASRSRASDTDEVDEYDVTARVVRTSLLRGEVSLKRAGSDEWEIATLNLPLFEGDTLATAAGSSRLEIQIDARNFVRLETDSVLRIVTLRPEGVVLSLMKGTATLRLASFDHEREYFEVDAPQTTIAAEQTGLYRLDVGQGSSSGGSVRVTVRDGGRARIYSPSSGFTLRDGRSAELVYTEPDEGDWQFSSAPGEFDDWDSWVRERERYLAERLRFEERERYYDSDIWGAEELDAYGDWVYADAYQGWVWRPHASAVNYYYNWAPYRYGNWRWCPPYGWTWVGDEPWGWAPYHYGRWVYYNNSWCWAPRGSDTRQRHNWWRPALVAFVYIPTPRGEHVAWYPLGYGQHDPHRRNNNYPGQQQRPSRSREWENRRRVNPEYWRGVTSLPAREFGRRGARAQAAAPDMGQRAVGAEPVLGRLPIAPSDGSQNGGTDRWARRRPPTTTTAQPVSTFPPDTWTGRRTGAGRRVPGVALDGELRRARIYQGREPRAVVPGGAAEATSDAAVPGTGAVARPPARYNARPRFERDRGVDPSFRDRAPRVERTDRPARSDEGRTPAAGETAVPNTRERRRPMGAPRTEQAQPQPPDVESPSVPRERPERTDRATRHERSERNDRPERNDGPPVRNERPARNERPVRNDSPASRPEPQETSEAPPAAAAPSPPRHEPRRPESEPPAPRPDPPPRPEPEHRQEPTAPEPSPRREEPQAQSSPPQPPPAAAAPPPSPPPPEPKAEPKEPAQPEQVP